MVISVKRKQYNVYAWANSAPSVLHFSAFIDAREVHHRNIFLLTQAGGNFLYANVSG